MTSSRELGRRSARELRSARAPTATPTRFAALVVLQLAGIATSVRSQDDPAAASKNARDPGWTVEAGFKAVYEDNVFHLSEDSLDRWRQNHSSDRTSGRFHGMDSANDVILTTELQFKRKITDDHGDDLRIEPGIRYLTYTANPKKSHPEFFLEMHQELGSGRALALDLEYQRDVFARNYLADVTDTVGNVSSSERRYEDGIFDEWSASASLEQRLWKRAKDSWAFWHTLGIRRLDLDAGLGVGRRWYYVPFSNRDRDRIASRLTLAAQIGDDWSATVGYAYDWDRTDNGREVLIRDEDDFNRDFNSDGDLVDQNVRAFERVDRSRDQQEIEARLVWDFAKRWSAELGGAVQVQEYRSNEPVDEVHRDRVDRVKKLKLDVEWRFRANWKASLFAGLLREDSNRNSATDANDEEVGYKNYFVGAGTSVRF